MGTTLAPYTQYLGTFLVGISNSVNLISIMPQTGAYAHHTENCGDKKTLKIGYLTLRILVQILYVGTPIVL